MRVAAIALALATALGLAACHKAREPANASTDVAPQGASGKGSVAANGSATTGKAGFGLDGGLGSTRVMGANASPGASSAASATDIPDGSTNRTSKGSVGNR